ncbi:hypothetical protein CcCBS67573_g07271 [Chytriomyces confervae]|uniref:Eukaryotic translation initiation factor 4E n=1 Tax=Chytriomyces confervae TaxID=246404 RepID=A0A507EXQ9_9FUNG|nr:hypothetical protein CcCBS67573_g07271 [Chytriomyces confervae]
MNTHFEQQTTEHPQSLALQNSWVFWTLHKEHKKREPVNKDDPEQQTAAANASNAPPTPQQQQQPQQQNNVVVAAAAANNTNYLDAITKLCTFSSVLALIGEQFDVGSEICGAVISMRHQEDILSVWNQNAESGRVNLKIRDTLKKVLNLPSNCIMEYKAHQASITDQSSYRNTALFL